MNIFLWIIINSVFATFMFIGIMICVMDIIFLVIGYDPGPDDVVDDEWYYREQR